MGRTPDRVEEGSFVASSSAAVGKGGRTMSTERLMSTVVTGDLNPDRDMSVTVRERSRAAIVAVAPLVLLAAFVAHPYIGLGPPDEAAIARAVASDTFRWGIAHLMTGVAAALLLLAFLAIRSYLRDAGDDRWSALALPFVIFGGTLYAILPGMEFAALASAETGDDVLAAQAAIEPWFVPVIVTSGVASAIGIMGFAKGVSTVGVVALGVPRFVVVAFGAMAVARIVPLTGVQFYVQAVAAVIAMGPLAYTMWRYPKASG
jgi:hypothetical protein